MPNLSPVQDQEVTFESGIAADGTLAAQSFWTWTGKPAPDAYGSTDYEAKYGDPVAGHGSGAITFSFDPASQWTATEQGAFTAGMALWSAVADVHFAQVATDANFTISRGSDGTAEAGTTRLYPGAIGSTTLGQPIQASLSIDTSVGGFGPIGEAFNGYGGYPWMTLEHELGHVLGLGHTGPYDEGRSDVGSIYSEYDNRAYAIMSYNDPSSYYGWTITSISGVREQGFPVTPQMFDILALQRIYGLPTSTPLSGGQVFGFNSNIQGEIAPFFDFSRNSQPILTLWDAGGGNTLDVSGFLQNATIDLTPGAFSSVGGLSNNIAIALDTRIDRVVGGAGADQITANGDGDEILAGGGADSVVAGGGHDTLFGGAGSDLITVGAASQGATVFGGQGDDDVEAWTSSATNYISLDIGNDTALAGSGSDVVLGGQGDDYIVGGAAARAGTLQLLFGNQGADRIYYAGHGGAELFGGQDGDLITFSTYEPGQVRYGFGNLGSDTLTAYGGADSLYGGQGDDMVTVATDSVGRNYLSGDLGNDQIIASQAGGDTLHGGPGADTLVLTAHAAGNGDRVVVGPGESTAGAPDDETNLQHIVGFTPGSDRLLLAGHGTLVVGGGGLSTYVGGANASEAAAFAAAYTYAYGDGGANAAHAGASEYLAVQESYGATTVTYVFTADHHAFALVGVGAASLQSGDVTAA